MFAKSINSTGGLTFDGTAAQTVTGAIGGGGDITIDNTKGVTFNDAVGNSDTSVGDILGDKEKTFKGAVFAKSVHSTGGLAFEGSAAQTVTGTINGGGTITTDNAQGVTFNNAVGTEANKVAGLTLNNKTTFADAVYSSGAVTIKAAATFGQKLLVQGDLTSEGTESSPYSVEFNSDVDIAGATTLKHAGVVNLNNSATYLFQKGLSMTHAQTNATGRIQTHGGNMTLNALRLDGNSTLDTRASGTESGNITINSSVLSNHNDDNPYDLTIQARTVTVTDSLGGEIARTGANRLGDLNIAANKVETDSETLNINAKSVTISNSGLIVPNTTLNLLAWGGAIKAPVSAKAITVNAYPTDGRSNSVDLDFVSYLDEKSDQDASWHVKSSTAANSTNHVFGAQNGIKYIFYGDYATNQLIYGSSSVGQSIANILEVSTVSVEPVFTVEDPAEEEGSQEDSEEEESAETAESAGLKITGAEKE